MASSILSEEQFLCPICLDVFARPVSTPCGHNFCMSCITSYWDDVPLCQCPLCKETFESRPDLKVNTFISGLVSQFASLQMTGALVFDSDRRRGSSGGALLCDICTGEQQEAVRSCLECLTSYCGVHLEPHHRVAGLKRHTLVEPTASLEDRMCKEHAKLLTLFCRNDRDLLCAVCARLHHADHDVAPVQRAAEEMKAALEEEEARVLQMIQERLQKVESAKESVERSKTETKDVTAKGLQDMAALVCEIQGHQKKLVEVMEEKQKAAEEKAAGFISGVEQELTELQSTATKLRELKETEDALRFLRSGPDQPMLRSTAEPSAFSYTRITEIDNMKKLLNKYVYQLRIMLGKMGADMTKVSDVRPLPSAAVMRQVRLLRLRRAAEASRRSTSGGN